MGLLFVAGDRYCIVWYLPMYDVRCPMSNLSSTSKKDVMALVLKK
jgi:hypothetical protein